MKWVKTLLKQFDEKVWKGQLTRLYKKITGKNSFFKGNRFIVLCEPVADLLLMQYNKGNYLQYQFYDIAVRVLAIENYYAKNDFGFSLYKKMHMLGGNYGQTNLTEAYYNEAKKKKKAAIYGKVKEEHSVEQFKELIQSYERNGYRQDSTIMADRNMMSMNGSHRIALALNREQDFINVEVHDLDFSRRYSIDWFWKRGFERKEIDIIKSKMTQLLTEAKKAIGDYYCILFPPAVDYFDDIMEDITLFDPLNIQVTGYKDYWMEKGEFKGYMKTIYSFDSILRHNLERKLYYILRASEQEEGKVPIRIISLNIENPMYRLKMDNGLPESVAIVRLKDAIRGRYKVKNNKFDTHYIGDYAHDVIIHSTDNYLSNNAMRYLMDLDTDLTELFRLLENYSYAIIESGIEKISPSFPQKIYLNDDIDIFVTKEEVAQISSATEVYLRKKYYAPWISIENFVSRYGRRVNVLLKGTMLFMFDYITEMPYLRSDFIRAAIGKAYSVNGYKLLDIEDELSVRLVKFRLSPSKLWHSDFISEHMGQFIFCADSFSEPDEMRKFYQKHFCQN